MVDGKGELTIARKDCREARLNESRLVGHILLVVDSNARDVYCMVDLGMRGISMVFQ